LGPESTVPMHPQLRLFTLQTFFDFRAIFFPEWPLIFLVITIHQVIWPSPGTLGLTRFLLRGLFAGLKLAGLRGEDRVE